MASDLNTGVAPIAPIRIPSRKKAIVLERIERAIQEGVNVPQSKAGGSSGYVTASSSSESEEETYTKPLRGRRLGDRFWKADRPRLVRSIVRGRKATAEELFGQAVKLKQDTTHNQQLSKAIRKARAERLELRRKRRKENLENKEKNRKKSEQVQVITNTAKLKKMKKKMARTIEKRDTSGLV